MAKPPGESRSSICFPRFLHHRLDLTEFFSFRSFLIWETRWHPEKVGIGVKMLREAVISLSELFRPNLDFIKIGPK